MKLKFQDQPLFKKISLYLFVIIMAVVFFIGALSLLIYSGRNDKWFYKKSYAQATSASESLSMHYEVITRRFVSIFGTEEFASLLLREQDEESTIHLQQKDLQSYLSDLQVSDYIIDSTMAYAPKTGNVFSYNWSSSMSIQTLLTDEDLSQIQGITWLSERTSPIHKSSRTIPIVYPLSTDYKDYVTITNNKDYTDIYVIVYLDYDKLTSAVTSQSIDNQNTEGSEFFLFSKDRVLLNAPSDEDQVTYICDIFSALAPESISYEESVSNNDNEDFWYFTPIENARLLLLYHTMPTSFFSATGITLNSFILFILFVILILAVISILLSRYISKPIQIQAAIVKEIEQGTYTNKKTFKTNDEIGKLNKAINQMYDTIQLQIEQIKKEESEKYVAQMLRTSEQVNPHFLYNSLDAIQSEVRKGNSDNAADLIQYLSEYMRIGLSYGDDYISIPMELSHANAYVHLMEKRFGKDINFIHQVAPELSDTLVPKTILQPLLENSIRHGFGIDSEGIPIQLPTLEISFVLDNDNLTIEVADNGSGFDVDKTAAIMLNGKDDQQRHIGLHNVYYRLVNTYGKENINFSIDSIPYYRNSIKFTINKESVLHFKG